MVRTGRIFLWFGILLSITKTILEYLDYRQFPADYYYEEKKRNNRYLLWYLGYHLSLDVNYVRNVIQGRSYLAEGTLPFERSYFTCTRNITQPFPEPGSVEMFSGNIFY